MDFMNDATALTAFLDHNEEAIRRVARNMGANCEDRRKVMEYLFANRPLGGPRALGDGAIINAFIKVT